MSERSGIFKIYKSTGAAQFSLIPCRYDDRGFISKEGAVLVEVAKCNGVDSNGNIQADWNSKINFAINSADLCNLMDEFNPKSARLFHNFKGTVKSLEFKEGQGKWEGTFMLQVASGSGTDRQQIAVPLTNGEYQMIMRLLIGTAAPKILGWS